MRNLSKLKSVDFFKKLPSDLTEATLTGAGLSIISTVAIVFLLVMEFASFLTVKTDTKLIVDQSPMNELLRINFNISFPRMSCEHLTLDVSDSLGSKKINLSKTVRKVPVSSDLGERGVGMRDETLPQPRYDSHDEETLEAMVYTEPMDDAEFAAALRRYPLLVVNFYAPWCPWCQRLAPTWQKVMEDVHTRYPESDGRIRLAKVDCTKQPELCEKQMVTGYPTIRIYRAGSDTVTRGAFREHESYHGDRTEESLLKFVDALIPAAGEPGRRVQGTRRITLGQGCQMSGFVLVKKVPGTMHFRFRQDGLSFDAADIDVSHTVHAFTFGNRPSPRRLRTLARLHPGGLDPAWADKLAGQTFASPDAQYAHEHYVQIVRTTLRPARGGPLAGHDAYEYTAHSHAYISELADVPAAKFSFVTSAVQVMIREMPRQWYHFLTTTCAIIGGIYTVCGILDGVSYSAYRVMKKVELGKQG